jgi:hypothetical protein
MLLRDMKKFLRILLQNIIIKEIEGFWKTEQMRISSKGAKAQILLFEWWPA